MRPTTLIAAGLWVASACSSTTRSVTIEPSRQGSTGSSHASTAATLGVPPGHLPKAGECRVWIPGTPPGKQPGPKSRSCTGIASVAPRGSWILYRPSDDRKVVHVRESNRIRVFDIETSRLVREEKP